MLDGRWRERVLFLRIYHLKISAFKLTAERSVIDVEPIQASMTRNVASNAVYDI